MDDTFYDSTKMEDVTKLKKLCFEVEKKVCDVERDIIGNTWLSFSLIEGYIHGIEVVLYNIVPDTLMDLCFDFYFESTDAFIDATVSRINYGLDIISYYEAMDTERFLKPKNNHKKKTTMNTKYRKTLELYKQRIEWTQYW